MKPRLLDLFCGAGGATKGYQRAGFHVVGVDIEPQPNYCGDEFVQADALEMLRWIAERPADLFWHFDAVHASPPCQHYANVTKWRGDADDHPALIAPVRERLKRWSTMHGQPAPWVIENVRTRELRDPVVLCGTQLGLRVRRHRYFESNWPLWELMQPCQHRSSDYSFDHGGKQPESVYRDAMGVGWMTVQESREAIPPAYTEWIGRRLLDVLERAA